MHTTSSRNNRRGKARRLPALCLGMLLVAATLPARAQDGAKDGAPPGGMPAYAAMLLAHPPTAASAPAIVPIPLSAAGSGDSDIWERTPDGLLTVRQVTRPALYPVLPAAGTANGTAVIIAPGGAFVALSFDSEGLMVANELAKHGITCFVLKYRLDKVPADPRAFIQHMLGVMAKAKPDMTRGDLIDTPTAKLAHEDGLSAVSWVRSHAADYGIAPDRIGLMGFSAGAMTTMNVAITHTPATRPDFIGVIYGAAPELPVPADAPPAFIALAADDKLLGKASVPIFEDWRAAGKPVELHIYARGDHGFGMRKSGGTADHWLEQFEIWLKASALVK